ncbi:hypothetical protein EVAR_94764_1 [Eumeta japonica]|uniref:Uncharacterized protein n=1 Tax=Eumeta variegata TaxID=151549 RepID=A0A4C2ABL2_EUMVA|nr:hypothetical protein EVAR_94764_1 [Eumeta japonica]
MPDWSPANEGVKAVQYNARNSAAVKIVTKASQWCKIRTRREGERHGSVEPAHFIIRRYITAFSGGNPPVPQPAGAVVRSRLGLKVGTTFSHNCADTFGGGAAKMFVCTVQRNSAAVKLSHKVAMT